MRILVIEDEHRIAQAIKKGLEQELYAVDVVYTGTEGYDMASTEEYDLIILDRLLPEMDGVEICTRLRKDQKHVPIIMLTAKGQIHDKVEGLNSGADDYMTKPFAFVELIARVKALTRRKKTEVRAVLSVNDLTLDTTTYEVKRAGKLIQLSNKEFSLLEYFMRNPNIVLTKDQIIGHVWNYDADILPNTVEVYMRNLRNKIDLPFKKSKSLLNTVRGFGYKIGYTQ